MATFNSANGSYQSGNKTLFEAQMVALSNGHVVDANNRFPVDIGNANVNIISNSVNVSVPNTITVNSSPTDPVHVHLTEVGNSGILTVNYVPVGGNVSIFNSNGVSITNTNPLPVNATVTGNVSITSNIDAFGRLRVSNPFTLMDSFHRYADNGKFYYSNTAGGTYALNTNTASLDLTLNTTSGARVYKESKRVYAYQPGKSLQVLTTFVMNPAKTNLRQRIGYFGANNGFFLERSDDVYFVKRSSVTGSVVDTPAVKSTWNVDPLDGTGPSGIVLNLDDPQIMWMDIEWLGVGSVRMGFVIGGQFIHCHTFHHANLNASPKGAYMQTACLPLRAEIENTSTTVSSSTLKQVCATVVSEGGYSLIGRPRTIGIEPVNSSTVQCVNAGTYYPVVSIRLNPSTLDAIALPKQIDVLPINAANYKWKIVQGATIAGAVWANAASDSVVQYNTNTAATMSGGIDLNAGYVTSTVQGGGSLSMTDDIFQYQLERNSFTSTPDVFTLAVASGTATSNVAGQILWEELA